MSLLLALALCVVLVLLVALGAFSHYWLGDDSHGLSEAAQRELDGLAKRRAQRESEEAKVAREDRDLGAPRMRPSTRFEREQAFQRAQDTRDAVLRQAAQAGGLNLRGPKGQSLIDHASALPTSVLETFDHGRGLFCELKGLGRRFDLVLRLSLLKESNVHLRVRRAKAVCFQQLKWTEEAPTGDERFDRVFVVEGKGFASVQPLHESEQARDAIWRAFAAPGVSVLTIKAGLLRLEGELDADQDREHLGALLSGLRLVASIYEGDAPQIVGLKATAVGGGSCPYCRDTLEDGLDVVACVACSTAIHAECHGENGGCPTLGCGARETRAYQPA